MQSTYNATIITKTRTDVTVQQKPERKVSLAEGRKYTILEQDELNKVTVRLKELVKLIAELPAKKVSERQSAWEEWGLLSRKKAKHEILVLKQKIDDINYDALKNECAYDQKVKELEQSEEAVSDFTKRLTAQEGQNSALRGQVDQLNQKINEARRQTESLQSDLQLIKERREGLREHLETEKARYRQEKERWNDDREKLLNEVASHRDQERQLQDENGKLKIRVSAMEKEMAVMEAQRGDQEAQLTRQLQGSRSELDKLKQSHAALCSESAEKKAKIETQDGEIKTLKAKIADLPTLKEEREAKDAATRRVVELLNAHKQLNDQNDALLKEIERLKKTGNATVAQPKGNGKRKHP